MAAARDDRINIRILANEFEKKWDLNKGIYSLHASRENGLVFKGARTEATISRQIIRQHGIGKLKGSGDNQHFYFIQVGRKSPYGEGTINIFDTPELKRLGQKKGMTGAAYIGEWITSRVYSKNAQSGEVSRPMPSPQPSSPHNPYHQESVSSEEEEYRKQPEDDSKEGGKWWEGEETNAEYEADINIPLVMQEGDYTGIMVEDTKDVYSMPTHSPRKKSEENAYYNLDPSPAPSPSTHKKKSTKKKKEKSRPSVMVEDTQDVYSIPDKR